MKLPELLSILPDYKTSAPEIEVLSVVNDARLVQADSVFVAIPGTKTDGHQFIEQAIAGGAKALIVEKKEAVPASFSGFVQVVADSREALDRLASKFYDFPSQTMLCFGVTGTNGKTSITYMLEQVLNSLGDNCGVLGTVNHHLKEQIWPSEMTTPDPLSLQKRLSEMKTAGARAIAMEVSSHALSQHRADAVQFDCVIFSNLSRDHLDYHESMEDYFLSKQRLFTDLMWSSQKALKTAIVNLDDSWGKKLRIAGNTNIWTFGKSPRADFQFKITSLDFSKTDFLLKTPWGPIDVSLPVVGEYNVANAVAVIAAVASQNILPKASIQALAGFPGVPGRMQSVPNLKQRTVLVDYAHSPDALENVLKTLKDIQLAKKTKAKIITVFGCGGDRDKGKRPLMAAVALKYSNQVIVTSDNPRTEDPKAIIEQILTGSSSSALVEVDRKKAIAKAIEISDIDDVILIAGKGHEDYQIIGTEKHHFSDFEIAKDYLQ
jgi:UDP-N-acetylmuramoyl-L-alanyl-D-glutamate--2,6-diaminopimelate ligase